MTLADPSITDATVEELFVFDEEPVRPVLNVFETLSRDEFPDVGLGLGEVLIGVEFDRFDLAERVNVGAPTGVFVERHKGLDENVQLVVGQLTAFEDADTEVIVVELLHLDHPVHDLALTVADPQALAVEPHRLNAEIDIGCEPAIELDLPAAVQFAEFHGREVEEPEVDRLLQLVGPVAGQQNRRDMGLKMGDLVNGMRIGRRVEQTLDDRCVIHGYRLRPFSGRWGGNTWIGHGTPLRCSASPAQR